MGYLYETHLHTCEASACGRVHGEDYISYMLGKGYSGIIVTDHFFNGNTCVPSNLPWKERVEIYCSGYERALKASEGTDLTVMLGVEVNFNKDEYLLYGIDKEWITAHEEIMDMTRHELHDAVRAAGGVMIQAHPYRERDYLSDIKLVPASAIDGIEVYNAANKPNMNALAYELAVKSGVPMTSGSDIHFYNDKDMGGMLFEHKLGSISDYVDAIKNNTGTPVRISPDGTVTPVSEIREQTVSTALPTLPVLYPEGK